MKRIFRGPWIWIVIAVVGVLLALQYLAPNGGYQEVDTSEMVSYIDDGKVESITFVDGDQEIRATLDDGKEVLSYWVAGQQGGILNEVQSQFDA
ncbi:MAG: ATP-dependent metallopeptidase FtsH/Yme1/Tma family protein, partial [Nocardioidaceae bacterium]